ncbi:MAG: leucine-rich repeat protein [Promethearchaeota archaeon]
MNSNSADIDSNEKGPQVLFCSACGLKFQPIKDKSKTLCPVCTNNYTKDPDFEEILLSLAYGHFMFNLGFRNPEVILRKAFKRILEFKYWQSKKEQYQDYLEKNLEDLKEKLYNTIIFYKVGNEIKQMRNELDIKADKFDIFISHSWDGPEHELVIPLVEALKESDYSIWFDKDLGLDPGDVKDYLKDAINDSKYCVPIFCKSYFEKENTLFELENILALKKKENIFPLWFSDIDTDFLKSQGDLGKEALKCSAITWTNAGKDLNVVIKKFDEFIEASQEIETYNGAKLYERDVNVLKYFERIIGETIPVITSKSEEDPKFGFMHENLHLIGIFLKETSENKKVQPLHLPKDIFKLRSLKYLYAPLIDLPPQISQLENLIELDISNGIARDLPNLTPLKKLKKFEIKGCGIIKYDEKTMDICDKFFNWRKYNKNLNQDNAFYLGIMLREMDIDEEMPEVEVTNEDAHFGYSCNENGEIIKISIEKNIDFLPETIASFPKLQRLNLNGNKLSSLPESIGHLTNLQTLDLGSNELSSLPEIITQMTWLKTLSIGGNQLSSLPESIDYLKNLQTLILSGNKLSSLPESIGALKNLEKLVLWRNKLSSLPEIITQMTWLKELDLGWNKLLSLPESIGALKNLQKLDLELNELSSLPESIGALKNLTYLNHEFNKLSSLPESIGNLTNL